MSLTATITSKRQITIPVKIFNKVGYAKGDRVIFTKQDDTLVIRKAENLVDELCGSFDIPEDQKDVDFDEAIRKAKS